MHHRWSYWSGSKYDQVLQSGSKYRVRHLSLRRLRDLQDAATHTPGGFLPIMDNYLGKEEEVEVNGPAYQQSHNLAARTQDNPRGH